MKPSEITPNEYNSYFKRYVDLVDDIHLDTALSQGMNETLSFFENLPKSSETYRYAEGKWTPKEILMHIIDTERVFAYRALQFARTENANLQGFDQDIFADNAKVNDRELKDLLNEYRSVRGASIALFNSFDDTTLARGGKASGNDLTVRAAGFLICGHERHHINVINEKYI